MNDLIHYNWMGVVADHCLDLAEDFYIRAGVSRPHSNNLEPEEVSEGDVVFVKTDYIFDGTFQTKFLPRIKNRFTLISGVSSYQVGNGHEIDSILNNENVDRWFCTNAPFSNSKVIPLPIGFEEKERSGGNQELLKRYMRDREPWYLKQNKILLPYHDFSNNPKRLELFNKLGKLPFVHVQGSRLPFDQYIKQLDKHKFVICLEGSGPDVHRNYEALLVGTVPINSKNIIEQLFKTFNLPGEFLNSWDSLDDKTFRKLLKTGYNMANVDSFLTVKFHVTNIRNISHD